MIATAHQQEELAGGGHGDHHHGDGDGEMPSITLAPGESGTLEVTFDEPGELLLGCHLPGHWEAGMRSSLTVTRRPDGERRRQPRKVVGMTTDHQRPLADTPLLLIGKQ